MEDFRLQYASTTLDPEKGKKLPDKLLKEIHNHPVPSVRPEIPEDMEYIGTEARYMNSREGMYICFDYYQLPDGSFRQEYRKKHQKIILTYRKEAKRSEIQKSNAYQRYHSVPDGAVDHSEPVGHQRAQSRDMQLPEVESGSDTGRDVRGRAGEFAMIPA